MAKTYQKIDTMYKRYQFNGKECPNPKWLAFKNKIILGEFSNKEAEYLFDSLWIAESKIDGTNSKIMYFPSSGEIKVGGKTDSSSSQHGQFEMLEEIATRIKPQLEKMFPKEKATFVPVKNKDTNKVQYYLEAEGSAFVEPQKGFVGVELEEQPIYIYGEYYGNGIQKCGKRYSKTNHFSVFDIQIGNWWTPISYRNDLCKGLGLDVVPTVGTMTLRDIEKMVREGFTTKVNNVEDPTLLEEGLVCRTPIGLKNEKGERVIVKVKYCDYIEYDTIRKQFTDDEFEEFNKWYHETIEA